MPLPLETARCRLRAWRPSDVDGIFALDSNPAVHRFLGQQPMQHKSEAEAVIAHVMRQYQTQGIGRWAVIEKATGAFVGWAGLKYETGIRSFPYYDLGYRLRQEFWGQGLATEVARASLDYGFQHLGLTEINAAAHADHLASQRVLEKVGMRYVEAFAFDGEPHRWYRTRRSEQSGQGL